MNLRSPTISPHSHPKPTYPSNVNSTYLAHPLTCTYLLQPPATNSKHLARIDSHSTAIHTVPPFHPKHTSPHVMPCHVLSRHVTPLHVTKNRASPHRQTARHPYPNPPSNMHLPASKHAAVRKVPRCTPSPAATATATHRTSAPHQGNCKRKEKGKQRLRIYARPPAARRAWTRHSARRKTYPGAQPSSEVEGGDADLLLRASSYLQT